MTQVYYPQSKYFFQAKHERIQGIWQHELYLKKRKREKKKLLDKGIWTSRDESK